MKLNLDRPEFLYLLKEGSEVVLIFDHIIEEGFLKLRARMAKNKFSEFNQNLFDFEIGDTSLDKFQFMEADKAYNIFCFDPLADEFLRLSDQIYVN